MKTLHTGSATRFAADLAAFAPDDRLGVAVSGGPDSLALLLLAAASKPGRIEAATVDHQLRPGSAAEASMVADLCATLGVPHATLQVTVAPGASLQAHARAARYAALAQWAQERGLTAVLTGHHADDQAETLLMRLARGAGLSGLSGIRAIQAIRTPGGTVQVIRPLLGWRKSELEEIVASAGLASVDDPANTDPRHDRTRVRELLHTTPWLDPQSLAASARHLAEAEEALGFAAAQLFGERSIDAEKGLALNVDGLPPELQRRLVLLAIDRLGDPPPRGTDLDRALTTLRNEGACTLGSLKLEGGSRWTLSPAPPRRLSSRPSERP